MGVKKYKEKNVFLGEIMKHNLFIVIQMCDQWHILTFNSKKCKIMKEDSGILVTIVSRAPNNVYILDERK